MWVNGHHSSQELTRVGHSFALEPKMRIELLMHAIRVLKPQDVRFEYFNYLMNFRRLAANTVILIKSSPCRKREMFVDP